ncbi:uncharacterized protein F5891DRAFT_947060, partial [Suillus fuscotomentosus]
LTDHCQTYIQDIWHGHPPLIVTLPDDVASTGNPWDAYALATVSPTMRAPDDDSWHQDLVYNTMWLLLNRLKIQMVLMTGLGMGTGGIGVANAHSR